MDGCFRPDHDAECLCDVVIPHPTGWVDDAMLDMWMGEEIAKMRGYTMPWDDEDILGYLTDLTYAKDNWESGVQMLKTENARPSRSAAEMTSWAGQTRSIIRQKLACGTSSITSVMDELGLGMDDMNYLLFTNRRFWTLEKLVEFEQAVVTSKHSSPHGLGVEFGMPYKSASKLASYWPASFRIRVRKTK